MFNEDFKNDSNHKTPNMLANADNGVYEIKIRYWGDEDVNDIHLENATADDSHISIDLKMPGTLFPKLDVGFSDTVGNICIRRFNMQFDNIFVSPDVYELFLNCVQFSKEILDREILDDIIEILTDLVPHLMTEE